jgi:uncharacterized membrane protein YkgB
MRQLLASVAVLKLHAPSRDFSTALGKISEPALRYSLVIVFLWIGAMKFTAYEAGAILGLVASSPLLAWLYTVFSQQGVSNLIGVIEILTALGLALGGRFPLLGLIGAAAAVLTLLLTLSFLLSAPGWEATLGGFPALSVVPGQFLVKDIVLLSVAFHLLVSFLKRAGCFATRMRS